MQEPYPQFSCGGVSTEAHPIAWSIYHGMQAVFQKSFSNGLQIYATYTWSKSMDDSSVPDDNTTWLGSFTSLQDPNKPWLEKSLSTFDIPQHFQVSYTYELPVGRKKLLGGNYAEVGRRGDRRLEDERTLARHRRAADELAHL